MTPSVSIVTPWLNQGALAPAYWAAVESADAVIVVDNGSDPPLDFAEIRFDTNEGFARACNAGLAAADTDVIVFLNNDVVMLRPSWLAEVVAEVEVGVLVGELRSDAHTQVDGERVPYLDGWCLAGFRDDFLELGGWDESLEEPSYYGDNLLCLRAREAGFRLAHVDVGLRHLGSVTSKAGDWDWVQEVTRRNFARYASAVRASRCGGSMPAIGGSR